MKILKIYATLTILTIATLSYSIIKNPWAILKFENETNHKTEDYGQFVANRFAIEISKKPKITTISNDIINNALHETHIRYPICDKFKYIRLGTELKTFTLVKGTIKRIEFEKIGETPRCAKVTLEARVYDTVSGLCVNGSDVVANSSQADGNSTKESLIKEALEQAAFQAAKEISTSTLAVAYVQNPMRCKAVISLGLASGYCKGLKVIIRRGRSFVAVGKVDSVNTDQAVISITGGIETGAFTKGLSPQDRVRPIINFPKHGQRGNKYKHS